MRVDLHDDPSVIGIVARTGLTDDCVVGKLLRIWGWAQGQTVSGQVPNVTAEWINRKVHHNGFAEAMSAEGWLILRTGVIDIPKFERWLSKGAKARLLDAQRKKLLRGLSGSEPDNCPENVRPTGQKRTGQKREGEVSPSTTPPKPPPADSLFEQFWAVFPAYRKQKKAKTRLAWEKAIKRKDPESILAAATEYAASPVGKGEYVCGPESWLNGDSWDDDRSAWQRNDCGSRNGHAAPTMFSGLRAFAAEAEANGTLDAEF